MARDAAVVLVDHAIAVVVLPVARFGQHRRGHRIGVVAVVTVGHVIVRRRARRDLGERIAVAVSVRIEIVVLLAAGVARARCVVAVVAARGVAGARSVIPIVTVARAIVARAVVHRAAVVAEARRARTGGLLSARASPRDRRDRDREHRAPHVGKHSAQPPTIAPTIAPTIVPMIANHSAPRWPRSAPPCDDRRMHEEARDDRLPRRVAVLAIVLASTAALPIAPDGRSFLEYVREAFARSVLEGVLMVAGFGSPFLFGIAVAVASRMEPVAAAQLVRGPIVMMHSQLLLVAWAVWKHGEAIAAGPMFLFAIASAIYLVF